MKLHSPCLFIPSSLVESISEALHGAGAYLLRGRRRRDPPRSQGALALSLHPNMSYEEVIITTEMLRSV
jgi:hypothetical protein